MSALFSPDLPFTGLPPALWLPFAALAAVALDRLLGEMPRWHPLVGFGTLAAAAERRLNRGGARILRGAFAWALVVLPWVLLAFWSRRADALGWVIDTLLLYLALGGRALTEHAARVGTDLAAGDLTSAREHVGWIVSRETAQMDESAVARACIESTLENGNDAIFGALFWFMLFGGAAAVLFRLANTLDAMWGYRNGRYLEFGRVAARVDDALNYLPARLTALSYALLGETRRALRSWRAQAPHWDSPNAGPVMSAGAGSLGLTLGGAAVYHGELEQRPQLGEGRPARGEDIPRALSLVRRSLALWLGLYLLAGVTCA